MTRPASTAITMSRVPSSLRLAGAIALGLALASLPFVHYRCGAPHHGEHADRGVPYGGDGGPGAPDTANAPHAHVQR